MIVLQGQEKIFLSKSKEGSTDVNQDYTKLTFTPTQADRFVLAFRNWLRRHGNSQPQWFVSTDQQPLPSTVLSKRQVKQQYPTQEFQNLGIKLVNSGLIPFLFFLQMLDRFEQHTQKCSSCRRAHTAFQTLQMILIGATVAFSATAGIPSDLWFRVLLAGFAILSAGLAYILNQLERNFVFVDYVHAEIE